MQRQIELAVGELVRERGEEGRGEETTGRRKRKGPKKKKIFDFLQPYFIYIKMDMELHISCCYCSLLCAIDKMSHVKKK